MSFTPPTCQNCISYSHVQCSCREQGSDFFGGNISPFHPACYKYISTASVYSRKNRPKKWFKAKTMEDMYDDEARVY